MVKLERFYSNKLLLSIWLLSSEDRTLILINYHFLKTIAGDSFMSLAVSNSSDPVRSPSSIRP